MLRFLLGSWLLHSVADAAPAEDAVPQLPVYGQPPTKQYSGYLDGAAGCEEDLCQIHYWYAEAEDAAGKNRDAPVVLWLNGGPGASAAIGMLTELGPLLIGSDGNLTPNPYAWTKAANLLIIEAPVGVGYSYCRTQAEGKGVCANTDKLTASTSRAALVDFFANKFPELQKKEFFIVGESYAGVYIPTLSKELLDHASGVVPLKGIAVGDPCTDTVAQSDAMDGLWYGHKMGFVPDKDFDFLWNTCGARSPSVQAQGGKMLFQERLRAFQAKKENQQMTAVAAEDQFWKTHVVGAGGPSFSSESKDCKLAWRKFLLSSSDSFSQGWSKGWIDDYSLFAPGAQSADNDAMAAYMMRPDVKKALHVDHAPVSSWPVPKEGFDYTMDYAACNPEYPKGTKSMVDFYREIVPKLERTIVYNGDTDPCVPYEGTRTAIERVGFPQLDGQSYRPWFYNHTAADLETLKKKSAMFGPDLSLVATGAQFGGEVVDYDHNLSFVTIHGSGHMVPQFRPQAALHFFRKLLDKSLLSPRMATDAELKAMSDDEFSVFMDKWTDEAKAAPYVAPDEERPDHANNLASRLLKGAQVVV